MERLNIEDSGKKFYENIGIPRRNSITQTKDGRWEARVGWGKINTRRVGQRDGQNVGAGRLI